jgi:phosphoglycerate dehydrogenase-like enzyme
MPKILLLNNDRELGERALRAAPGWSVEYGDASQRTAPAGGADVVVVAGFGRTVGELVAASPDLKWVQTWSAGVDAVPLELLKSRGIYLTNASGVHAFPISESIFALILSFARGLHTAELAQRESRWDFGKFGAMREIHGSTLGILGAGTIGRETAKLAKAFDMRVLGYVRNPRSAENFDALTDDLNSVLEQSDYVVNILPLTNATRGLMGAEQFATMKRESVYVTVGRGPTTDYAALKSALERGAISGAGLDVTAPEPLTPGDSLWTMPNVVIMPHVAGSTQYYNDRAGAIFMENLESFIQTGKPCRNVVNLDEGY